MDSARATEVLQSIPTDLQRGTPSRRSRPGSTGAPVPALTSTVSEQASPTGVRRALGEAKGDVQWRIAMALRGYLSLRDIRRTDRGFRTDRCRPLARPLP